MRLAVSRCWSAVVKYSSDRRSQGREVGKLRRLYQVTCHSEVLNVSTVGPGAGRCPDHYRNGFKHRCCADRGKDLFPAGLRQVKIKNDEVWRWTALRANEFQGSTTVIKLRDLAVDTRIRQSEPEK